MALKKQIILIGDSLTEWNFKGNGWGKKMQNWYGTKVQIINEGYAGYNSKMIKEIISSIVKPQDNTFELLLCTILLGTNDCFLEPRIIPFQEYKQNILSTIDYIRMMHPKTEILLITPPITGHPPKMKITFPNYINALYEIKKERKFVNIVNLHNPPNNLLVSDLTDGVHINDSGNDKLFKNVQNAIMCYYPFCPSKL